MQIDKKKKTATTENFRQNSHVLSCCRCQGKAAQGYQRSSVMKVSIGE